MLGRARCLVAVGLAAVLMSGCTPHGSATESRDAADAAPDVGPDAASAIPEDGGPDPFAVLRHATSVTLYRVHPRNGQPAPKDAAVLDGDYVIESSGPASDPHAAAAALLHDIAPPHSPEAMCFIPTYAFRISDGARTLDYIVCFHCLQTLSYEGGKFVGNDPVRGTGDDIEELFVANNVPKVAVKYPAPRKF